MLRLRNELETKLTVLSLPVDICVQHAVRGNSALQGALNAALSVLGDIEAFEESLRDQEILEVIITSDAPALQHPCSAKALRNKHYRSCCTQPAQRAFV